MTLLTKTNFLESLIYNRWLLSDSMFSLQLSEIECFVKDFGKHLTAKLCYRAIVI